VLTGTHSGFIVPKIFDVRSQNWKFALSKEEKNLLFSQKPNNTTKPEGVTIKNMSKTMTTLTRLRQHYREDQENIVEASNHVAMSTNNNMTELLPSHETVDVVEFHPEEIEDLTPLKPEEADECQLADILQGDDLSFLLEQGGESNNDTWTFELNQHETAPVMHRIPSDIVLRSTENRSKRLSLR
jgi:hypothetical protein